MTVHWGLSKILTGRNYEKVRERTLSRRGHTRSLGLFIVDYRVEFTEPLSDYERRKIERIFAQEEVKLIDGTYDMPGYAEPFTNGLSRVSIHANASPLKVGGRMVLRPDSMWQDIEDRCLEDWETGLKRTGPLVKKFRSFLSKKRDTIKKISIWTGQNESHWEMVGKYINLDLDSEFEPFTPDSTES